MRDAGDEGAYFIYTGQVRQNITRDVIRVRVHPYERRIRDWAFHECSQLAIVDLGKGGLEEIGTRAFSNWTSLCEIMIPPTVRRINSLSAMDSSDRPLKN